MVHGGLPFPGTGCPVPDVGFNFFIDLYQMLELIDTLYILRLPVDIHVYIAK